MITVVLGGDVNLQGRTEPEAALTPLSSLLNDADLRFVNLEGPLSGSSGVDIPHKPNWRHSPPEMITALTAAEIDVVSVANDVTYPPRAALASLAVLDRAGIAHCGAGANVAEAHAPAVVERFGQRIAFLAYTSLCWPVGQEALENSPGVAAAGAYTAYQPDPRVLDIPGRPPIVRTTPVPEDLTRLVSDVRRARTTADHVIVSMHWGLPGDHLAEYQVGYAHAIIDAGADLIVGHGSHTVQAVEVYRGRPILYSLGNLVFDWPAMRGKHLDGLLAGFALDERPRLELIPIRRDQHNECSPLTGDEASAALHRLATLSARRGTRITVGDGIGAVEGLGAEQPSAARLPVTRTADLP
ncbi:CapA family protein [Amycolatopsis panacis]|uniref:CapA family protein n=1 Tax=Amycolatopsis panacis TaxID=2340917 RepID=A0A419I556_9PSEU|nr:CapA family protein [Amycolatopsis panacis]RJQ85791.1 CapA family protein [Amycolatopsis panacis]